MTSKNILLVFCIAIVAMLFFPPFVFHGANGYTSSQGYGFVLSPPKMVVPGDSLNQPRSYDTTVDTPLLFTQIFAISIVAGVCVWVRRGR